MVSRYSKSSFLNTTRNLEYIDRINKIPEYRKITNEDYIYLPCATDYSMVVLIENPLELFSILYGHKDLRKNVLSHIKKHRKYYQDVSRNYLSLKRIDFVTWMASMMVNVLPVDELCLHALCMYLNIHITVDYIGGLWTTLNIPNVQHDLSVALSDIHLAYRGNCAYGLLCKTINLRTTGKLLMEYKLNTMHEALIKPNAVVLLKWIDEEYPTGRNSVNDESPTHEHTDDTEIYEYPLPSDSADTEIYDAINYAGNDSDSTEIYEIKEQIIGSITYSTTKLLFKCPSKFCNIRCNTRKKISKHYRLSHKQLSKCEYCYKSYSTPHSLIQHLYKHKTMKCRYLCKCGAVFPFVSQLKIHKIKHRRKSIYMCTECSIPFKYRHDMMKHRRSHTEKEYTCENCDYVGNSINLKAHQKQHNPKHIIICTLCKELFRHRMSLWRHKQRCRRSKSPEF